MAEAAMRDADGETRRLYCLRVRATGEMLRVEASSDLAGDSDSPYAETTYEFTTDTSYPLYDAGSAEMLALAFCRPGGSQERPYAMRFRPEEVEPVVVEEVVTRRVSPTGLPFEIPVTADVRYAIDLRRDMARFVPGVDAVLDAVDEAKAGVEGQRYPGSEYPWGKFYVVGLVLPGEPGDQPDGMAGRIVTDAHGHSTRRALAVLPAPEWARLAEKRGDVPASASVLVCLSDARPVPPSLADAIEALSTAASPAPR